MSISKCVLTFLLFFLALDIVHLLPTCETDKSQDDQVNADPILIEVSWNIHDYDLHTIPTLQVVTNPLLARQFSPVHKQIFASLKELNAEYTRYAAWFPYPKLAVAELDPPSGLFQCGNVGQDASIDLSCAQSGGVISKVDFASYGTSSGACGQMKQGACHAANSTDIVQKACVGKQNCSVPAAVDLFGDPCKFYSYIFKIE
jgi:hypothetical protein